MSLRPHHAFNTRPRRLSTSTDAFQLHPDVRSYGTTLSTPSVGDDLVVSFDKTDASRWLRKNAAAFHFEMSFGKDNVMGVSYEPWHYRFVGDSHSLRTFAAPRAAAGK